MIKVPQRKKFRLTLRSISIILVVACSYWLSYLMEEKCYSMAVLPTILIILISVIEFVIADIITDSLYPPQTAHLLQLLKPKISSIEKEIKNYLDQAINDFKGCDKKLISATFHLKVEVYANSFSDEKQDGLLQITDYVGGKGGRNWRFTLATKGIIGKCIRTEIAQATNFNSIGDYSKKMIMDFGFTKSEIHNHTKEARSYYAAPAFLGGKIIGVIYFFSTELQVFPGAVDVDKLQCKIENIVSYLNGNNVFELLDGR